MCFRTDFEKTAIISWHSIKWLLFIPETESDHWEVWQVLNVIRFILDFTEGDTWESSEKVTTG